MASVKWVRFGPLTLGATVSDLRTVQAGAVGCFLKSRPCGCRFRKARRRDQGRFVATDLKVNADDSGGSGGLARRDRARPDLAFSLPLTGERPKSLKSDPRRMPEPVHDAVDPRGKLNCHAQSAPECSG